MKVKTKLSLGVGILFMLIIVLIGVSVSYINALSNDTQNILVANYNTIDYSRQMINALDKDMTLEATIIKFNESLLKQQNNITEAGELNLTSKLTDDFQKIKTNPENKLLYVEVRKDLSDLMLLNMQAIQRKSIIAESTAKSAITVVTFTGVICFLLAFTLLLNLPGSIANPIKELTNSIKEIAAKNYSQRVNFEGHNEFGDLAHSFNTMAKKLQEYNDSNLAKLMMEKKRIETLVNNMHDPVIVLDETQKIIFINEEALKVAGLRNNDTIGKHATDIAIGNDLLRSLLKDIENTPQKPTETIKIFADNKQSYFNKEVIRIEITPTGESHSKHIGNVILLQNITPFKELDLAKTNFIATVSHEFKTPIASIKMGLQLLENEQIGQLNDEQKKLINSVRDDSNRLLKITGELLNLTQVESGNVKVSVAAVDAKQILMYAIRANKTQAESKQIAFEVNCDADLPIILADKEKTSWVLVNIISNAIAYSKNNSVIVLTITVNKLNSTLSFIVKDTGEGISAEYKDRIFDRYFRVPHTNTEGTGLGLAICKEYIEAQGGVVKAESEYGIGSTFTVLLNIANIL